MKGHGLRVFALVLLITGTGFLICGFLAFLMAASNMGFKVVKPIVVAGGGNIGDNWTSLPYKSPYATAGQLCAKLGLSSTGTRAVILKIDPVTGASNSVQCGTAAADAMVLVPGLGVQIRQPAGGPSQVLVVGSHDPAVDITIPDAGTGNIGNYWYSVPFHATAETAADLCAEAGLSSTGSRASILRINAATGGSTSVQCGTSGASALSLILGESVRLREPNGPKTFTPSYY